MSRLFKSFLISSCLYVLAGVWLYLGLHGISTTWNMQRYGALDNGTQLGLLSLMFVLPALIAVGIGLFVQHRKPS